MCFVRSRGGGETFDQRPGWLAVAGPSKPVKDWLQVQ